MMTRSVWLYTLITNQAFFGMKLIFLTIVVYIKKYNPSNSANPPRPVWPFELGCATALNYIFI